MVEAGPNSYSPAWFESFPGGIPAARTAQEAGFVREVCPQPSFRRILDVCCGMGRHARALAALGYTVTGVERDARAVVAASAQGGGPTYLPSDIRDYLPESGSFDAVIVMSQSFGFFEPATNRELLARWSKALRPQGRVVLDLWQPGFFRARQGQRRFELPSGPVQETKSMTGDRLSVRLDYPDGGRDDFEWQTFSAVQMADFAPLAGLTLTRACTDFDATVPPAPDKPRVQYVLQRST